MAATVNRFRFQRQADGAKGGAPRGVLPVGATRGPVAVAWALIPVLLLAACTVGPDYRAPETEAMAVWRQDLRGQLTPGDMRLAGWWRQLGDDTLDALIDRATEASPSLALARARLDEARADAGVAQSLLFPTVNVGGLGVRSRQPRELFPLTGGQGATISALAVQGAWEADLWGRVRRTIRSAEAAEAAAVAGYQDTLVVLYAEIANRYVSLRILQQRLAVAERNVAAQRQSLALVENRLAAELAPELEAHQATQALATSEATIPRLRSAIQRTRNALAVLVGAQPGALDPALAERLDQPAPIPRFGGPVGVGIPADTLRQRPDIRRAERLLAAQSERIGARQAERLPRLTLSGVFGTAAVGTGLFDAGNRFFSIGPSLAANVFSGGALAARVDAERARTDQALAAYRQTVLVALQDVEAALIAYGEELDRRRALERAVAASRQAVTQVKELYEIGLTDFQNVLDSERSLLSSEDQLVQSRGLLVTSLIALYRAVGGGWQSVPVPGQPPATGATDEDETP
nr:efflux transporter outer membrane subunit [Rhodothalassium salexigens]